VWEVYRLWEGVGARSRLCRRREHGLGLLIFLPLTLVILTPLSTFCSYGWPNYLKSSYATSKTLSSLSLHYTPGPIHLSRRWRHYVPPKRRNTYPLRCAETQTKAVFWWTRAVKTWKLTSSMLFCTRHIITVEYIHGSCWTENWLKLI
jgi:hypothetical protein